MATLLYHWKCDEGTGQVAASSATANNGTIYNSTPGDRGVTWTASGYNGAGVIGDGTSGAAVDHGVITSVELFAPPVNFTVMCWFKTSHPTSDVTAPMVACLRLADTSFGIGIWMEPGNPGCSKVLAGLYAYGLGRFIVISPVSINFSDGEWHNAAFSCRTDTDTITLYIDCDKSLGGELVVPGNILEFTGAAKWWFAGGQVPVNYMSVAGAFDGLVDDVRVYDAYMTEEEVCAAMRDFPPNIANAIMFSCNT